MPNGHQTSGETKIEKTDNIMKPGEERNYPLMSIQTLGSIYFLSPTDSSTLFGQMRQVL